MIPRVVSYVVNDLPKMVKSGPNFKESRGRVPVDDSPDQLKIDVLLGTPNLNIFFENENIDKQHQNTPSPILSY